MRRFASIILGTLLLLISPPPVSAQNGYDLFQQALVKDRAEGNAKAAIALYERVGRDYADNRELAARAQLQAGLLYAKLGQDELAQRAFRVVVDRYADQAEVVTEAQSRLRSAEPIEMANPEIRMRQVWTGDDVDDLGTPSPDGKYLSMVDWETGDLAVRDVATGEVRRLTDKGPWTKSSEFAEYSAFSRDGRKIAYAWWVNAEKYYELRTINVDGTRPRTLLKDPDIGHIEPHDWSPDGRYILTVLTRVNRSIDIAIVSTIDGSVRVLQSVGTFYLGVQSPRTVYPTRLAFSPDGRYVAYDLPVDSDRADRDVYVMASDGEELRAAIDHPADDFLAGWDPDGRSLLFVSDRTGLPGLWRLPFGDGKLSGTPELLKADIGMRTTPLGITRDGAYFYASTTGESSVYRSRIDGTGQMLDPPSAVSRRITGHTRSPAWSPDGKLLAYLIQRGRGSPLFDAQTIVIRSEADDDDRRIHLDLSFVGRLDWSPDGRRLLTVAADADGRRGVYLIDVESGRLTMLFHTAEGTRDIAPYWFPDGESIFVGRRFAANEELAFIKRDIETGQESELLRVEEGASSVIHRISGAGLSPTGREFAFHHMEYAEEDDVRFAVLTLVPTDGGEAREAFRIKFERTGWAGRVFWSNDGRHVYFIKRRHDIPAPGIWRYSVEDERVDEVKWDGPTSVYDIRFQPGSDGVAFVAGRRQHEVWAIENFLPKDDGE